MIYDFLSRPRFIKSEIRRAEAEQDNLRLSMYPSAVRYDTDKVQSSPVDPMPRYAEKMDELQTRIKRLWLQLNDAQDDIIDKMLKASIQLTPIEQDVIVMFFIGGNTARRIAFELGRTERGIYKIRKRAMRKLEKSYPEL